MIPKAKAIEGEPIRTSRIHAGESQIRIKGHRLGIEDVVRRYNQYMPPENIAQDFPGLSLEKIYATITYYLRNKADVDTYIAEIDRYAEEQWQQEMEHPSPMRLKMRAIKEQWQREGRLPPEA